VPAVELAPSLVAAAVCGAQRALEQLLRAVVDDGRRLAQRMPWHPQDAEDATQEILVKVATRLSTFRGDARATHSPPSARTSPATSTPPTTRTRSTMSSWPRR
jgi:Sigma-70 region 2